MRLRHVLTLTAVPTALLLSSCSSSGTKSGSASPPASSSSPSTSDSSSSPASSAAASGPASSSGSATTSGLSAALLDASDIPGYTASPDNEPASPLPCTPSAAPLTTTYAPVRMGKIQFKNSADSIEFSETLLEYDDVTVATRFTAAAEKGFACSEADFGGTKGRIVPVKDVAGADGSDFARQWDLGFADGSLGTAMLARKDGVLIGLTFQATKEAASQLQPAVVLQKALAKLAASR